MRAYLGCLSVGTLAFHFTFIHYYIIGPFSWLTVTELDLDTSAGGGHRHILGKRNSKAVFSIIASRVRLDRCCSRSSSSTNQPLSRNSIHVFIKVAVVKIKMLILLFSIFRSKVRSFLSERCVCGVKLFWRLYQGEQPAVHGPIPVSIFTKWRNQNKMRKTGNENLRKKVEKFI